MAGTLISIEMPGVARGNIDVRYSGGDLVVDGLPQNRETDPYHFEIHLDIRQPMSRLWSHTEDGCAWVIVIGEESRTGCSFGLVN